MEDYESFGKRMEQQYPKLFAEQYGGFACGKGWWPMLENLCQLIQHHIDHNKDCKQVVIQQIKEKFGTLRFYYQGGDDFIHGAVWLAESMSDGMCEECGAPGERRGGGWIKTLCEVHHTEREQKRSAYMKENGLEE